MNDMDQSYDVVVLGLGAMGSAAAYQLAKRGVRVLGLDQFSPPHSVGSSHGDTRITRQAIGEGAAYTPLALRSNEIWRELERQTGLELYHATGGLIIADPSSTSAVHGRTDFLQRTLEAAEEYNIAHEMLTAKEINRRLPPFKLSPNEIGYYEPGAGFLRPERCITAQMRSAKDLGADLHVDERMLGWEPAGEGVQVETDQGRYQAGKLIVSAGPWTSEMLGSELKELFPVYRQVQYWFDIEAQYEEFAPGRFPVFIWFGESGDGLYGFPAVDGRHGGIKVASEQYRETTSPESVSRLVTEAEKREMYVRRVQPFLEGVRAKCLRAVTCLYTVTPDSHFVLDFHPSLPQVILASPCSGHGFKHSAAIGEVLADLAMHGQSRLDISAFSLQRLKL